MEALQLTGTTMESVEVHRRTLKGGGLLNLFDWNSKSRKKLLSDSNGPESANQGKVKPEILPVPGLLQTNAAEENASSSNSGRISWNCNYSSSSSIMSCKGCEDHAQVPGVVARLMGLDSMPTADAAQSCSPASHGYRFPRGSQYNKRQEAFTRELGIERFQTEILPPRTAKPISVTQHKLLSPIKSPAFVPTKNAAHVMEAAAKIIGASAKEAVRSKIGHTITASVPLRIQDLKMKLEAQQPKKPDNFKIVNRKSSDRTSQGMGDARIMRRDMESGNTSRTSSSKMRSFLPTAQVKGNMQKREGKSQAFNRNLPSQGELKKSQTRTSTNRMNANVLKQNNQKQNSLSGRLDLGSKASLGPKISPNKTRAVNTVTSRAESMTSKVVRTSARRNLSSSSSYSGMKTSSQKKGTGDKEISSTRNIATNILISNEERPVKSKISSDVISFTFTSPIKRSSEAHSPVQAVKSINGYASGKSLTFLSPPESVIGESSFSVLLEQKLRELKDRIECYTADGSFTSTSSLKEEEGDSLSTCTSSLHDSVSSLNYLRSASAGPYADEMSSLSDVDSYSTFDGSQKCQAQAIETMEECSTSATSSRTRKDVDHQLPSVSNLGPLLVAGRSPDSMVTCTGKEEPLHLLSAVEFPGAGDDKTALSNSISSSSLADIREDHVAPASLTDANFYQSINWEIEYMTEIIGKTMSMLEDCSSAYPSEIINPSLFDELESCGNRARINNEEETNKLRRKILFDFVSECLVLRCQDLLMGTPKGWARLTALFRMNRLLAEEIYREISGGNCIGDMMVDVLVEEDMSSKYRKWLDFRVEMFEEGMEIGQCILSSLVDELVAEFVVFSC